MGLFKNKVGRPSNESIKKRRITYLIIILIAVVGIGASVFYTVNYFRSSTGTNKDIKKTSSTGTKKVYFFSNGSAGSDKEITCSIKNCTVTTPKITPKSGYTVVGWSTSPDTHTASIKPGKKLKNTKNQKYYAITKKIVTIKFYSEGLDYIEYKSTNCTMYNKDDSCIFKLPRYNKKGKYNIYWSENQKGMYDLCSSTLSSEEIYHSFFQVGKEYVTNGDITLYPNFNNSYCDEGKTQHRYRSLDIAGSGKYGDVTVEIERGVSKTSSLGAIEILRNGYKKYPWLFVPSKIFVLTNSTYNRYSIDYSAGYRQGLSSYSIIDARYDLDTNGYYHELGHALDDRYKFITDKSKISETKAFENFYNSISNKLDGYNGEKVISKTEMFAAMVTNFIWHYKEKKDDMRYYGLKKGKTLTQKELENFGKILDSCLKEMGMKGSILTGKGSKVK